MCYIKCYSCIWMFLEELPYINYLVGAEAGAEGIRHGVVGRGLAGGATDAEAPPRRLRCVIRGAT